MLICKMRFRRPKKSVLFGASLSYQIYLHTHHEIVTITKGARPENVIIVFLR